MSAQVKRRLSIWRLLISILVLSLMSYFAIYGFNWWQDKEMVESQIPWFAPYVDVTARPTYPFEQLSITQSPNVMLAFIVSDKEDPCVPTWGTHYDLQQANDTLDLDRRIARLRQQDGQVAVSFGGAINNELALYCQNHEKLKNAYFSVIERYELDTIDLDLENEGLTNLEAARRRALAISEIQQELRGNNKALAVWLTLPVTPQGLTADGTNAIKAMLDGGVDLAGINIMTMDYGASKDPQQSMSKAAEGALVHTHRQLGILYEESGTYLSSASIWRKLGATPMLGQNDIREEIFSLQDAQELNIYAVKSGLGRLSMWSANRDIKCGENYVDTTKVSDSCHGIQASPGDFARQLSINFTGTLSQNAKVITKEDFNQKEDFVDDPASSPYQIWQESGAYLQGTKVVWKGNVYEAKWWTKGDVPDNPVLQSWETPWQLLGPVLPGEKPVTQLVLPKGTYPQWSGRTEYIAGQRVMFEGTPYQAKWWNQGESPAAAASNADSSPWLPLTQKQIELIIDELGTKSATIRQ